MEERTGKFNWSGNVPEAILFKNGKHIKTVRCRSVNDVNTTIEYYVQTGIIDDSMMDG